MKSLFILSFFIFSASLIADPSFKLGHNYKSNNSSSKMKKTLKNFASKASFSYGLKYLGPSLSPDYQDGATYSRTKSGQAWHGGDQDPTASTQLYHTTSIGYKVSKNVKLSYTYTFQEDLNKGIEHEQYNKDGSLWEKGVRTHGLSYNNQRINATVTNIYSNKYLFFMSNFYYERPTTEGSIASEMTHGLGVQPLLGIFSNIRGLYHGFKLSLGRSYYKRQDYNYNCGGFSCNQKYQTFKASFTSYIGYNVSDKLAINADLIYDWDQVGDQVDQWDEVELTNLGAVFDKEFNDNLDNVIQFGPDYKYSNQIGFGVRVLFSINKPDIKRSAIIGNFSLSI